MSSPRGPSSDIILNSVLHDVIGSSGSSSARPSTAEEGWDAYTETISGFNGSKRTSYFSAFSVQTGAELSDWEKYYGGLSAQDRITRISTSLPNTEIVQEPKEKDVEDGSSEKYAGGVQLSVVILGVCLAVFLVALNRQIVTTVRITTTSCLPLLPNYSQAIPNITDQFRSYEDVGWYGSSYLLTACAFQPLYGRIFMAFHVKITYMIALVIFELGSLVCGVAPTSTVLIIGRAIQGLGSAGIVTGSFVIIGHCVPLVKRPVYFASIGLTFGLGAVTGPMFGGIFTDLVNWRWCFYFNLPIGGATIAVVLFFFKAKEQPMTRLPFFKRAAELDHVGTLISLCGFVMFFLGLQYGEERPGWKSPKVIGLLVGAVVMFVLFGAWEWWMKDAALIPIRIATQRTVVASCLSAIFIYGVILIHGFYIPIWFQAIRGTTALQSGVNMVPYMLANMLCTLASGIVVSKTGYFTPPAIVGCAIATVGCGLISTLSVDTSTAKWIGYEILASGGLGIAVQIGFTGELYRMDSLQKYCADMPLAVQTVVESEEISIATSAIVACQSMGGAIFVSVGNTILQNRLIHGGTAGALAKIDIDEVIHAGATRFRSIVPEEVLPSFLGLYNAALQKVFYVAIAAAGMAFLSSLPMEWNSVKDDKKEKDKQKSGANGSNNV